MKYFISLKSSAFHDDKSGQPQGRLLSSRIASKLKARLYSDSLEYYRKGMRYIKFTVNNVLVIVTIKADEKNKWLVTLSSKEGEFSWSRLGYVGDFGACRKAAEEIVDIFNGSMGVSAILLGNEEDIQEADSH